MTPLPGAPGVVEGQSQSQGRSSNLLPKFRQKAQAHVLCPHQLHSLRQFCPRMTMRKTMPNLCLDPSFQSVPQRVLRRPEALHGGLQLLMFSTLATSRSDMRIDRCRGRFAGYLTGPGSMMPQLGCRIERYLSLICAFILKISHNN